MSVFGLGFWFYWGLKSPRYIYIFLIHGTHPFILVLFLILAAVLWMLSWGLLAYNHLNITCSRRGMASVAGTALNHTNLTLRAHICAYIKHILCIQAFSLTLFLSVWRLCTTHLFQTLSSLFLSVPLTNNIYISQTSIYFSFLSLSHTSICIYIFSLSPWEAFLFLPFTHAHTCTFSLLSPSYSHFFPPPQTHSHSPYTQSLSHPNPICLSVCLSFYFILEEYLRLWHTG